MAPIVNFRPTPKASVRHAKVNHWRSELERAQSALFSLDPDCDHNDWVRIAMASKSAGLSFDDFHGWSQNGEKYQNESDCRNVWKSIKPDGNITERTLFYLAQTAGWLGPATAFGLAPAAQRKRRTAQTEGIFDRVSKADSSTSTNAIEVWSYGKPAPEDHPYIVKKQGMADGLHVYPENAPPLIIARRSMAGWLMVPCWNTDGTLQTIQFISPAGKKLNFPKVSLGDAFYALGDIEHANRVFLVEGIGQAWAVCRATDNAATVVSFSAGRMQNVAHVLRQRYPSARFIVLPDKGKEALAADIARSINGEWCLLPPDKEDNYDVNDLLQDSGINAVQAALASPHKPPMRFPLISAAELMNAPPMEWLVHGVLPMHGIVALYGPSGSGKSFLALDLAASLSAGSEQWFDHRIKQCPVTYVCLEGKPGITQRTAAWSKRHGAWPDSLNFITESFNLLNEDDVLELAKSIKANNRHNGLIIIDTLNRAAPYADENASADMGRIIAAVSQLQALVGGLVMLVHHAGKDHRLGMRGHTSLPAVLDTIIEVRQSGSTPWWKVVKCKDGEQGHQCFFRLAPVFIGKDEQGQDVTSCVVVAENTVPANVQRKTSEKRSGSGDNQKIAKPILDEMLEVFGEVGMSGVPEGSPCIRYADAVDAVSKHLVCEQKRRKERAKDAIDSLINHNFYRSTGEWLWRS